MEVVETAKTYQEKAFFYLSLIILILEILFVGYGIAQNTDTIPIIYSINNDAANGMIVAYKSNWLSDNGFYAYGNLYYRVANTINMVNPFANDLTSMGASDKAIHFSLMIVSFVSLIFMSLIMASLLFLKSEYIFISTAIFIAAFISSSLWYEFILVVHPDLFVSFLVFSAILFSLKYLINSGNQFYYYMSSVIWGLSLATKLSSLFYIPCLALLFIDDLKSKNYTKVLKYFLIIAIVYFLIGFPQNFQIKNTVDFLFYQSGYSLNATIESFKEWILLFINQSIYLIIAIGSLALIAEKKYILEKNK